jgi:hypothetical protein
VLQGQEAQGREGVVLGLERGGGRGRS